MKRFFWILPALLTFFGPMHLEAAVRGNRYVLVQMLLKKGGNNWDAYPLASRDILAFLKQTTSVDAVPERRVVSIDDPELFDYPFVIVNGEGQFSWTQEEREIIKRYLSSGGFMFVEDRLGEKGGSFDYSFRKEIEKIFPERSLVILPREHAVFRSFYLLRAVGGRKLTNNYLEGLELEGHTVLIYSQNDVLGAWAKDLLGNFLYECSPGGEKQRWESQKLMMNVILYSLTGTYKTDAVHAPFINRKIGR